MNIDNSKMSDTTRLTDNNPFVLQVIGVGGCGCSVLESLHNRGIDNLSLVVCDSDPMKIRSAKVDKKVLLKRKIYDSSDVNDIFEFEEDTIEEISNLFDNDSKLLKVKVKLKDKSDSNDSFKFDKDSAKEVAKLFDNDCKFVVIVAGLGGETGTDATLPIARAAKAAGKTTIAIATIPFLFEGENRIEKAQNGIESIRNMVDKIFVLENESITELIEDTSFTNAFASINIIIIDLIKSLIKNIKKRDSQ